MWEQKWLVTSEASPSSRRKGGRKEGREEGRKAGREEGRKQERTTSRILMVVIKFSSYELFRDLI